MKNESSIKFHLAHTDYYYYTTLV